MLKRYTGQSQKLVSLKAHEGSIPSPGTNMSFIRCETGNLDVSLEEVGNVKDGDNINIRGVCSGCTYWNKELLKQVIANFESEFTAVVFDRNYYKENTKPNLVINTCNPGKC